MSGKVIEPTRITVVQFLTLEDNLARLTIDVKRLKEIAANHGEVIKELSSDVGSKVSKAELMAAMTTTRYQQLRLNHIRSGKSENDDDEDDMYDGGLGRLKKTIVRLEHDAKESEKRYKEEAKKMDMELQVAKRDAQAAKKEIFSLSIKLNDITNQLSLLSSPKRKHRTSTHSHHHHHHHNGSSSSHGHHGRGTSSHGNRNNNALEDAVAALLAEETGSESPTAVGMGFEAHSPSGDNNDVLGAGGHASIAGRLSQLLVRANQGQGPASTAGSGLASMVPQNNKPAGLAHRTVLKAPFTIVEDNDDENDLTAEPTVGNSPIMNPSSTQLDSLKPDDTGHNKPSSSSLTDPVGKPVGDGGSNSALSKQFSYEKEIDTSVRRQSSGKIRKSSIKRGTKDSPVSRQPELHSKQNSNKSTDSDGTVNASPQRRKSRAQSGSGKGMLADKVDSTAGLSSSDSKSGIRIPIVRITDSPSPPGTAESALNFPQKLIMSTTDNVDNSKISGEAVTIQDFSTAAIEDSVEPASSIALSDLPLGPIDDPADNDSYSGSEFSEPVESEFLQLVTKLTRQEEAQANRRRNMQMTKNRSMNMSDDVVADALATVRRIAGSKAAVIAMGELFEKESLGSEMLQSSFDKSSTEVATNHSTYIEAVEAASVISSLTNVLASSIESLSPTHIERDSTIASLDTPIAHVGNPGSLFAAIYDGSGKQSSQFSGHIEDANRSNRPVESFLQKSCIANESNHATNTVTSNLCSEDKMEIENAIQALTTRLNNQDICMRDIQARMEAGFRQTQQKIDLTTKSTAPLLAATAGNLRRIDDCVDRVNTVFEALKLLDEEHSSLLSAHQTLSHGVEEQDAVTMHLINQMVTSIDNFQQSYNSHELQMVDLAGMLNNLTGYTKLLAKYLVHGLPDKSIFLSLTESGPHAHSFLPELRDWDSLVSSLSSNLPVYGTAPPRQIPARLRSASISGAAMIKQPQQQVNAEVITRAVPGYTPNRNAQPVRPGNDITDEHGTNNSVPRRPSGVHGVGPVPIASNNTTNKSPRPVQFKEPSQSEPIALDGNSNVVSAEPMQDPPYLASNNKHFVRDSSQVLTTTNLSASSKLDTSGRNAGPDQSVRKPELEISGVTKPQVDPMSDEGVDEVKDKLPPTMSVVVTNQELSGIKADIQNLRAAIDILNLQLGTEQYLPSKPVREKVAKKVDVSLSQKIGPTTTIKIDSSPTEATLPSARQAPNAFMPKKFMLFKGSGVLGTKEGVVGIKSMKSNIGKTAIESPLNNDRKSTDIAQSSRLTRNDSFFEELINSEIPIEPRAPPLQFNSRGSSNVSKLIGKHLSSRLSAGIADETQVSSGNRPHVPSQKFMDLIAKVDQRRIESEQGPEQDYYLDPFTGSAKYFAPYESSLGNRTGEPHPAHPQQFSPPRNKESSNLNLITSETRPLEPTNKVSKLATKGPMIEYIDATHSISDVSELSENEYSKE